MSQLYNNNICKKWTLQCYLLRRPQKFWREEYHASSPDDHDGFGYYPTLKDACLNVLICRCSFHFVFLLEKSPLVEAVPPVYIYMCTGTNDILCIVPVNLYIQFFSFKLWNVIRRNWHNFYVWKNWWFYMSIRLKKMY